MTIVETYLKLTDDYKSEYGPKTLVLMQVGSFFEVYGLQDKDGIISGSDIIEFSEICDMNISKKIGQVQKNNVMMAGFGIAQLDKYLKKLQDSGYTIPVYTQDSPTKNTTRSLYQIVSPGTFFSQDSKELSNNISTIWVYQYNFKNSKFVSIGLCNIDIFTGKSCISEYNKEFFHNTSTYDDVERFISIYNPNEVLVISNFDKELIDDIIQFSQINCAKVHKIDYSDKKIKNCEKQTYQNEVIERFFIHQNPDVIIQELRNYPIATQGFIFLLDFIYTHNPHIINRIEIPKFENIENKLLLANHSLKQLNIINDSRFNGKISSVSNFLNNCVTPIGKRNFMQILLNPSTDINYISDEYNITEYMLEKDFKQIRSKLLNIKDIEKLYRKSILKKTSPKDIHIFNENLSILIELSELIDKNFPDLKDYSLDKLKCKNFNDIKNELIDCQKLINDNINCKIAKCIDDTSNEKLSNQELNKIDYINKNINNEIDNYFKLSVESVEQFECLRKYFSVSILNYEKSSKTTDVVKIHETAKSEPTLQTTKRRGTFLQKFIKESENTKVELDYFSHYSNNNVKFDIQLDSIEVLNNGSNNSTVVITSKKIKELTNSMNSAKNKFIDAMEIYFSNFMEKLLSKNIKLIIEFVSLIDLLQNKCYIAKEYNYCKPEICENIKSFYKVEGLRHCLIEHINQKELYVTNDFSLGIDMDGMLLYGTNAVGKTSFIKSIGIAIIMAQAGLYVPATKFIYYPYQSIFTRILGNDNLFKGLSTFAVEMSELRTILRLADNNSLILGDELCSGTESDSALSIFVSGLEILHKNSASFMFATHFHEIVNYEEIIALEKLKLFHMTVFYDKSNNKLVYDRKLKHGPGDSMYGLEVCKALALPDDFLKRAHYLRNKYNKNSENILDLNESRYNSKIIKGKCKICNKLRATEVHHLIYQKDSDNNGFINTNNLSFHKNNAANLIPICNNCHDKIHNENLKYIIKKTSKGYELFEE